MRYRLGLDIGTASCGLVAVALNVADEPTEVLHHGVYIFSEPVLPAKSGGVGEPKKAARRAARMARRVIDRRARRLKRIAMLAQLIGLNHHEIKADDGQSIHALRATAAFEQIKLDDLIRVFLKLVKRRGYAGAFKAGAGKSSDQRVVEPGINQLREAMQAADVETAGQCKTLGQYLHYRFSRGETLRLKEAGLYAHREMLIEEFNLIWVTQAEHYAVLRESRPDPIDRDRRVRPIRDQFFDAIFYQRPLKSVAPMVGNCSLEVSLPRAPLAQPAQQVFRIEKQLADLRWGMGRNAQVLSLEQKKVLRDLLTSPDKLTKEGKLSFKKIYEVLEAKKLRPEYPRTLNMERSSREELIGDRTSRAMRDLGVLDLWLQLNATTQLRIINFLADLGSPEQVHRRDWYLHFSKTQKVKSTKTGRWEIEFVPRTLDEQVVSFVNALVASEKFDRLGNMGFETGRASYSVRALQKLTNEMCEQNCDEYNASQKLYASKPLKAELLAQLPSHKLTGNVVVDVALRVVRRAVNDALIALGCSPADVVVELSRDMALGLKARGEREQKGKDNQTKRHQARKELEKNGLQATDRNILRYLLWEQQDAKHCPYCARHITLAQATDGNETNFEHILPRSLTRVGKQRNHLVLAHRSCNDEKGDRTPFAAFGHDIERWQAITYCAKEVFEPNRQRAKARLLLLTEYEDDVLDDESIQDFSARQFAETSWIGKLTLQWLKTVCPRVEASRGILTAHLRRIWKLETVISQARFETSLPVFDTEKKQIFLDDFKRFKHFWEGHQGREHERTDRKIDKRIDHRHHLIDALVIAMTSRSLFIRMAEHYKQLAERRKAGEPVKMKLYAAPPLQNIREQALALVKSVEIKHKQDRQKSGSFFQDAAYRKTYTEDGKSRLAKRVELLELTDKKGDLDKARKSIQDIISAHTRRVVSAEFEARLSAGQSVREALALPILNPQFRCAIKKVAVYQRIGRGFVDGSSAYNIQHGGAKRTLNKYYISDGYAFIRLCAKNGKIVSAESISVFSSYRRIETPTTDEQRFYRGDTIVDPATGSRFVICQLLANAAVRVAPVTETRSWSELGAESGGASFRASSLLTMHLER